MKKFAVPAFTLAEVLITLAVIGVVAAMTLPTLIAKINEKADSNQKAVIEAKLIQGLNMLDLHGGMNDTYSSTAEFVEELGKYMKITAVCDGSTKAFTECLPYSELNYIQNGEQKSIELSKINSASSLNLPTGGEKDFMNPVAIVLGDGTPIILSYDKKCISDPDSVKVDNKQIHSCVAGIYDFNGSRKPNLYGGDEHTRNDLISFNGAKLEDSYIEIGGVKIISQAKVPTGVSCSDYKGQPGYNINDCYFNNNNDYWVGAMVECNSQGGHLPSASEMRSIANELLVNGSFNEINMNKLGLTGSDWYYLWSSREDHAAFSLAHIINTSSSYGGPWIQYDQPDTPYAGYNNRDSSLFLFICIAN